MAFGSYKCATAIKDSATYYVQVRSRKEKNPNEYKEEKIPLENNNTKQQINKFDSEDSNWYLLIVARPSDKEKSNLNVVPMQNNFPDKIEFNRLRINEI